ncbi:SDR family NAD(P)-dependent oxidoreductase [Solitalea lacus]|uniref:SDR family NAD(P)-dependent oxidoreductase n=1 Tax=Solitalea lacus TaxID=2911172 RepID=UPI001EDC3AEB|nr:SDR family oxidoreductase [Solitalea lacus]UKJ09209.1 SDR family oxidoreductase [Solitalea lacus]
MSYALITGASKGIGKAIAECLAQRSYDLLLVAQTEELLRKVATELGEKYKIKAQWLALDLAEQSAAQQVLNWVQQNDFPVSILVNNAGYGLWGNFNELTLNDQNNMLQVNVWTMINLTHLMIPVLLQQPQAYILNTGSMAGFQSIPTFGLYSASKALVNTFTRALAHELKHTSISVSLLAPGSVKTGFVERAGMLHLKRTSDKMALSAETVARIAVKGMFNGRKELIPGLSNQFTALMVRLLPKSVIEQIAASLYRRKD